MKKLLIILALGAVLLEAQDLRDFASVLDFPGIDPSGLTDSSAGLAAAWAAMQTTGSTLYIPCGTYQIAAKVTFSSALGQHLQGSGACTIFNWTGNATDPMFYIVNCSECSFGGYKQTNSMPLKYGIWQLEVIPGIGISNTLNTYHDIHVQGGGSFLAPTLTTFFYAGCTGSPPSGCSDANNDQMHFVNVHVYGASHSAFTLANTQVYDVLFERCSGLDTGMVVEALNGSFTWKHGDISYSGAADFFIAGATADQKFVIEDVETENSAQLLNVSGGALSPPPNPGAGGVSSLQANVTLKGITHDGLATGCRMIEILNVNTSGSVMTAATTTTGVTTITVTNGTAGLSTDPVSPSTGNITMANGTGSFANLNGTFYATNLSGTQFSVVATVGGVASTSTTSLTIPASPTVLMPSTQTLTTGTGLGADYFSTGPVLIVNSANAADYMEGTVTSYNTSTGVLVASITSARGSGAFTSWNLTPGNLPNFLCRPGADGPAHYIVFNRASGLSIETSAMNIYGRIASIFYTTIYANLLGYGAQQFSVSDTTFGFGGIGGADGGPGANSVFGTTPQDNFYTLGGGALPSFMKSTSARNQQDFTAGIGHAIPWPNSAAPQTTNYLYNLSALNFQTYNAIIQNDLIVPSVQIFSSAVGALISSVFTPGAATCTGTCTGSYGATGVITGGVPQNAFPSAFAAVPYAAASLGGPELWIWGANGGGIGEGPSSITAATCALTGEGGGAANTSASTLTIGTGAQTLTTQTGLTYYAGSAVDIVYASNGDDFMVGTVTSYNGTTGVLVVNITAVGGSGTFSSWGVGVNGTVTATDTQSNEMFPNGELVTVTLALPSRYNVALAPVLATVQGPPLQFQYTVASCPATNLTSNGTSVGWVGPLVMYGPTYPAQNLAVPGTNNAGWSGPTIQWQFTSGYTIGDVFAFFEVPSQTAPVVQFGTSVNAAGTNSGQGPIQCGGGATLGSTPVNCLDAGDAVSGPHLTQHRNGFGVAERTGTGAPGPDVQVFDTQLGFNPWVPTKFSGLSSCSSANYGALVNINDLTGGLTIGATATGTGTATATSTLLACNGANWIVASGTTATGIPYPGAGVPLSTGTAWGTSYTVGTAASDLVQLDGSAKLPAVSGANLTGIVTTINGVSGALSGITHTSTLPCAGTQVFTNGLLTSVTGTC